MAHKALLMILDGWGIGNHSKSDAIFSAHPEYWNYLIENYPHSELQASGENVGLPDGQMGNSEVGHLNIGAGRVVYQDLVKINKAIADRSILNNPEIKSAYSYCKENGKSLHLMGLTSTGGVHSSFEHIEALCDIAKEYGLENVYLHCFMDGRDTDPHSGKGFIERLTDHCKNSAGVIASIIGRYYAMDRDKRWDRVKVAYDLLVKGEGKQATDMVKAMQESYDEDVTDEFVKPINKSLAAVWGGAEMVASGIPEIDELLAAIRDRPTGTLPPDVEARLWGFAERASTLTGTERTILQYYMDGYTVKDIPELACISASTVKTHNRNLYRKLEVDSFDELKVYIELFASCGRSSELLNK